MLDPASSDTLQDVASGKAPQPTISFPSASIAMHSPPKFDVRLGKVM